MKYLKENKENIFYFMVVVLFVFVLLKLIINFDYEVGQVIGMIVPFAYLLLCFLYITTFRFQRFVTKIVLGAFIWYGTIIKVSDFLEGQTDVDEYFVYHLFVTLIMTQILSGFQFHKSKRYSTRVYYLKNLFRADLLTECKDLQKRYEDMNKQNCKCKGAGKCKCHEK